MTNEVPLQWNMFTGELDDTRTRRQKKLEREREQPEQIEMFSQRDIAQFGVNPRPLLPISDHTKLGLIFEDSRTEEEQEWDRQREAEDRTYQLFDEVGWGEPSIQKDTEALALIPYVTPCLALTVIQHVNRAVIPYEGDLV